MLSSLQIDVNRYLEFQADAEMGEISSKARTVVQHNDRFKYIYSLLERL